MRVTAIHHTIALVRAPKAGIQHINHQVETSDDVLRSYYFLSERRVPIVFGPRPASDFGRALPLL